MGSRNVLAVLAASVALGSCSETEAGTIDLLVGGEADAFTRAPAPTRLVIEAETIDTGAKRTLYDGAPSSASAAPLASDAIVRILVRGLDASGATLLGGRSPFFDAGGLEGGTLRVFVQRTGEFARWPDALPDTSALPLAFEIGGRGLFVIPRGKASGKLYDFIGWNVAGATYTLPRAPRSVAVRDLVLLLIDDQAASFVDLSSGTSRDVGPPPGESFASVAGGETIVADDGSTYVVGATRTDAPSDRVLRIAADGTATFVKLTAPRQGAGAAWVASRGLVVVGGSATAAGAELLSASATTSTALPFPPDPATDQGATALDGSHVFVTSPPRLLDLGCSTACAALPFANLPAPLVRPRAGILGSEEAIVVGDDASGTRVFRVSAAAAAEVPLRVPRKGGTLVPSPSTGAWVVVGGSGTIESFRL